MNRSRRPGWTAAFGQSNDWLMSFDSTGPKTQGAASALHIGGRERMHGNISGGIDGYAVNLQVHWTAVLSGSTRAVWMPTVSLLAPPMTRSSPIPQRPGTRTVGSGASRRRRAEGTGSGGSSSMDQGHEACAESQPNDGVGHRNNLQHALAGSKLRTGRYCVDDDQSESDFSVLDRGAHRSLVAGDGLLRELDDYPPIQAPNRTVSAQEVPFRYRRGTTLLRNLVKRPLRSSRVVAHDNPLR